MKSKSTEEDDHVPLLIRILVNLFITFGLSLSIYLLIANVFLTVHKLSLHTQLLRGTYDDDSFTLSALEQQRPDLFQADKQYYDCSQGVLTLEECDLLNRYHNDYLHSVRSALLASSSKSLKSNVVHDPSGNSLRVNTSFFIH